MPFNGAGVFQRVRNWVADAAAGIKIRADLHDSEDDGFATGLTNCITKDGQTTVTQNIPWNSKRITALADPINDQDAATKKYTDTKFGAGGIMTGPLTISMDGPQIYLNDTDASVMAISGQRSGKQRWWMRLGNGAEETGANAGSNFDLLSYDDNGAFLGQVLAFDRASGMGFVPADPTSPLGIATKQYVDAGTTNKVIRDGDAMTGALHSNGGGEIQHPGILSSFIVNSFDGQGWAAMSFHVHGMFIANFGLGQNGNFYMSGGSHGAAQYQFWTTRDFAALPSGGVVNARLLFAGDVTAATGPQSSPYEPYAGGVLTGWQWALVTGSQVTAFRIRYMQVYTTSWFTIGYA